MSKLSKDKRDKIILVGLVTAAATAAIWLLVIKTQNEGLKNVRAEVVKLRDQLKRGQATLSAQAEINENFENVTQKLKQRESAMAAPNDMYSWLIQTLNTFRLGYQVDIPQFGRELPSEVGIFPKFPYRAALFNVRGTGYYHDFGRFLADFENAFPYIRVQNIELDAPSEHSSSAGEKLQFKMELLTLVKPIAQ